MLVESEIVIRLVVAAVLGALIGLERQLDNISAGFRTHMLICLGATLFTIMSFEFVGTTDPSRIAAGLVTGIGFLGAGAIFKDEHIVKGLTTAADLWVAAAMGLAIGIGQFFAAIVATVIVVLILVLKKISGGKA